MKYYPIADRLTEFDMLSLSLDPKDVILKDQVICCDGTVTIMVKKKSCGIHHETIHPYQRPLAGDWFLSGTDPEGYRAINDLYANYYIAELVLVKTITITTQVEVTL